MDIYVTKWQEGDVFSRSEFEINLVEELTFKCSTGAITTMLRLAATVVMVVTAALRLQCTRHARIRNSDRRESNFDKWLPST